MSIRVAFQGEPGAYSELAATTFFGAETTSVPLPAFRAVFAALAEGEADAAVIPIENALAGSIHENYDWLLQYKLPITGELILPIRHCLLVLPGVERGAVRRVISHPQALQQCRDYLDAWPDLAVEAAYDTAGAAKRLVDEQLRDTAAIASEQAATQYGLAVLARGIESNHHNYTRFLVLQRQAQIPKSGGKTSIVFALKDGPGALFKSLAVFALRDINLLKIESRPLHGHPFRYYFYLDMEGSQAEPALRNALRHLEELATFLQVLGSYPAGRLGG